MLRMLRTALPVLVPLVLAAADTCVAEIVSFSGSASVEIRELKSGQTGQTGSDKLDFPADQASLPLQVVTILESDDGTNPSAAGAAAQFADPTELNQVNPEEFAINLTLNSISPQVSFESTAITTETRTVEYAPGELGPNATAGTVRALRGRLFLDGALSIIATDPGRDLTGARVRLTATVVQRTASGDATVFDGAIELKGAPGGEVSVEIFGDFPTSRLILTDLTKFSDAFDVFRVLILPNLRIDYGYDAVVGEAFDLIATVRVDAATIPDNVGISAVLGTPVDTLSQVLTASRGASTASDVVKAIQSERENPTGEALFDSAAPVSLSGLCGGLGFEALLGASLLGGLALLRRR